MMKEDERLKQEVDWNRRGEKRMRERWRRRREKNEQQGKRRKGREDEKDRRERYETK